MTDNLRTARTAYAEGFNRGLTTGFGAACLVLLCVWCVL